MGQIGVTQDNPWDYSVTGFSTPEGRHLAIPYDLAMASGVNELNFLAARLEKLDAYEIGTLNAALQQKNTELRTISRIIDYADNLDYYVNLPDVRTVAQLGDYYLNRSGMVDMPDEWKPAIDTAAVAALLQARCEKLTDIPEKVDFFDRLPGYDAALFTNKKSKTDSEVSKKMLEAAVPALESLAEWTQDSVHGCLIGLAEHLGVKNATLMWPVRIAAAGRQVTPGGAVEICHILGKEETLRRLRLGLGKL